MAKTQALRNQLAEELGRRANEVNGAINQQTDGNRRNNRVAPKGNVRRTMLRGTKCTAAELGLARASKQTLRYYSDLVGQGALRTCADVRLLISKDKAVTGAVEMTLGQVKQTLRAALRSNGLADVNRNLLRQVAPLRSPGNASPLSSTDATTTRALALLRRIREVRRRMRQVRPTLRPFPLSGVALEEVYALVIEPSALPPALELHERMVLACLQTVSEDMEKLSTLRVFVASLTFLSTLQRLRATAAVGRLRQRVVDALAPLVRSMFSSRLLLPMLPAVYDFVELRRRQRRLHEFVLRVYAEEIVNRPPASSLRLHMPSATPHVGRASAPHLPETPASVTASLERYAQTAAQGGGAPPRVRWRVDRLIQELSAPIDTRAQCSPTARDVGDYRLAPRSRGTNSRRNHAMVRPSAAMPDKSTPSTSSSRLGR